MKLTDIWGRLKGLVKKSPAKPARPAAAPSAGRKPEGKRADVKRARKAAGQTRKRG